MRVKTFQLSPFVSAALPYLWGFAAAAALDHVIDVQTLLLPVMAGAVVVSTCSVILWRPAR